ncbi:MAG: GNAT family N-acetyltransferase, partial [Chloroflexota bacterium]|nr:GNAT family N-acetyltransferase [Chloroflexota bacterium]
MSGLSEQERAKLPESAFAFPRERKEPLVDAHHVRDAIARFDQVQGVTNEERDEAWRRIQQAACMAENVASERVMQKVGMSFEEIQREYSFVHDRYEDL